jgi:drug/metabolite transporter (DMT)-like permease
VIGVLVLGERLDWYQPVGAAVVLTGVAVSQRARRLPAPQGLSVLDAAAR